MDQKYIDAYLRTLNTLEQFKKGFSIIVSDLDTLHLQPIRMNHMVYSQQHREACYEFGIDSPEAEHFLHLVAENNQMLIDAEKEYVSMFYDSVDYSYTVQKAFTESLRKSLGDLLYMSKFGSEYEKDQYFAENDIIRSRYFNGSNIRDTYRINKNISDIQSLSNFMNNVVLYFEPNSINSVGVFEFSVSHSSSLVMQYINSVWELYDTDTMIFSDTDSLEVLQYLNIVR